MKVLFFAAFMLLISRSYAQNLVPNPGFEDFFDCPSSFGQVRCPLVAIPYAPTVNDWISVIPNSPDYYNGCSSDIYSTVPNNYYGYKPAHNGNAYTGIALFSAINTDPITVYAEYIECKLTSPLIAGATYEVSCFVKNMFPRDQNSSTNFMAVKDIGALFSDTQVLSYTHPLKHSAVSMKSSTGGFLQDTTNWVKISGYFTAKGGEEWMVLGGFYGGNIPPMSLVYPHTPGAILGYLSYYTIDDVSVLLQGPCDTVTTSNDTILCHLNSLPLTVQSTAPVGSNYYWNTEDTSRSIKVYETGTYWCTVKDGCNVHADTFHVKVLMDTITQVTEMKLCKPRGYKLTAMPGGNDYKWNTGETGPGIIINGPGAYICSLYVNCTLYIQSYLITTYPDFDMFIKGLNDTTVCTGTQLTIGSKYEHPLRYEWNTGDTGCCIQPQKTGTYILTVSDECSNATDSADIVVKDCINCLFVPNAFTPNKDGLNDYFGVTSSCDITGFSMRIYNRWGQEIFTTNDINARWNGMYKADFALTGTYFYFIEYSTIYSDEPVRKKGDISLIR